jgi:hypothetical protein
MSDSQRINVGNVDYDYDEQRHFLVSVKTAGKELKDQLVSPLNSSLKVSITNPLKLFPHEIVFSSKVDQTCIEVFESIEGLKNDSANELLAALAASYLFEGFSRYWLVKLQSKEMELTTGIQLWRKVLTITNEWEKNSSAKIHKGTPLFFLAEKLSINRR